MPLARRIRRLAAVALTSAIAVAGLAVPASAAPSFPSIYVMPGYPTPTSTGNPCATSGSATTRSATAGGGQAVGTIVADIGDTITFTNECSTPLYLLAYSTSTGYSSLGSLGTSGASTPVVVTVASGIDGLRAYTNATGTGGQSPSGLIVLMVNSGGGGGGGGSSPATASEPAPVPAALSLSTSTDSGVTCRDGADVTGYVGQWVTLPAQTDCSLAGKPGARLLGWSTSPSFPVAVAQRQADNGWGTYELTNEEGEVTAVFIPAGHAAFVSGANTLHPVWSA